MLNLKLLTDLSFWFETAPFPMSSKTTIVAGSFFLFFIALKIIGRLFYLNHKKNLRAPEKKLISRTESMLVTMGLLGLAWVFFRSEGVPFLSMRFWFLLWLAGFAVWVYLIVRYGLIEVPKHIASLDAAAARERYLPRKKGA